MFLRLPDSSIDSLSKWEWYPLADTVLESKLTVGKAIPSREVETVKDADSSSSTAFQMAVRVDFLNPDVELDQSQQKRKNHRDID